MKYATYTDKYGVRHAMMWTGGFLHRDAKEKLGLDIQSAGMLHGASGVCHGESTSLDMTPAPIDEDLIAAALEMDPPAPAFTGRHRDRMNELLLQASEEE